MAHEIERIVTRKMDNEKLPRAYWITGLSASGKSTLGSLLFVKLQSLGYKDVVHLDGEEIRSRLDREYGYTPEERFAVVKAVVEFVSEYQSQGKTVIISIISHRREMRDYARSQIKNFNEVHLACPVDVCAKRDYKGHYVRAFRGEYNCFIGVTESYERSEAPEFEFDTSSLAPEKAAEILSNDYECSIPHSGNALAAQVKSGEGLQKP